ncbi:MAG TPA: hypothetical protein VK302_13455 [Terriglobales bacterium]|nr:hypothetical protein [Terriglobales bacterium]
MRAWTSPISTATIGEQRQLWLPLAQLTLFGALCLLVYGELEGLASQDSLFWIIHPCSIDYRTVRSAMKFFSLFVYIGVFAFQIWIAERGVLP